MTPLPFVWPYLLAFWIPFFWAYAPEMAILRRARKSAGAADAKSVQVIMLGMNLASLAAWPLAWVPALQFASHRVAVFFAGIAVLIAGALLRRHCWRMLGSSFTGDVQVRADQEVVARGAYAYVRHPSYTAGILLNGGVGIALGSWASAALVALASFLVYRYRMNVEERALLAVIGTPYEEFMRTRKRLIPFVY